MFKKEVVAIANQLYIVNGENRVYLACQGCDWIRKGHLDNDGSIKFLRERGERDQTSQLAMGGGGRERHGDLASANERMREAKRWQRRTTVPNGKYG